MLPALLILSLVACAVPEPVRVSIIDIEIRHSENREEPVILDRVAEDQLAKSLEASGRFRIVHRRFQHFRPEPTGPVIPSDWVLYGTIEESVEGSFDTTPPRCICDVYFNARVIRSADGIIIYSKRLKGTAEGQTSREVPQLMDDATRKVATQLAQDLIELAR